MPRDNDTQRKTLTVIIPAYNEESRIGPTLEKYTSYFSQTFLDGYVILVVLNGCRDHTEDVVKACKAKFPTLIDYVVYPEPIGKGGALKKGLEIAKTEIVAFTDADASTRPEMLHKLISELQNNPQIDCVVGSRNVKDSVVKGKTFKREIMSRGFNLGVNALFWLGIKDTQCGAKVLRQKIIPPILPYLSISNMAFDVNLLVEVRRAGGKTLEVPIEWEDDENSTIKTPFKTSLAMALSVIRLRIIYSPLKPFYPIIEPIGDFLFAKLTNRRKTKM